MTENSHQHPSTSWTMVKEENPWTDLRISSLQFGLSSPAQSSFTPESCRLFPLRSSSVRCEGLDFRAEVTTSQWVSDRLLLLNLWRPRKWFCCQDSTLQYMCEISINQLNQKFQLSKNTNVHEIWTQLYIYTLRYFHIFLFFHVAGSGEGCGLTWS